MNYIETDELIIDTTRIVVTNKLTDETTAVLKHANFDIDTDEDKIQYIKTVLDIE